MKLLLVLLFLGATAKGSHALNCYGCDIKDIKDPSQSCSFNYPCQKLKPMAHGDGEYDDAEIVPYEGCETLVSKVNGNYTIVLSCATNHLCGMNSDEAGLDQCDHTKPNTQCYTCCKKENCNSLEKVLKKLPEGVFEAGEAEEAEEYDEEYSEDASTRAPKKKTTLKKATTEFDEYAINQADYDEADEKKSEDEDEEFLDKISAKVSAGEDRLENGGDVYDNEDEDETGKKSKTVGKTATRTDDDAAAKNETDMMANFFDFGPDDVNNTDSDYQGDEPVNPTGPPNDFKSEIVEIEGAGESDEGESDDAKDSSETLTASVAFTLIPIVVTIIINFIN